jgi:hypothetical protein
MVIDSYQNQWLTERQVAEIVGLSLSKLRQDRHFCRGFPYTKAGRSVRYLFKDIEQFMLDRRIIPQVGAKIQRRRYV